MGGLCLGQENTLMLGHGVKHCRSTMTLVAALAISTLLCSTVALRAEDFVINSKWKFVNRGNGKWEELVNDKVNSTFTERARDGYSIRIDHQGKDRMIFLRPGHADVQVPGKRNLYARGVLHREQLHRYKGEGGRWFYVAYESQPNGNNYPMAD